MKGSKPLLEAWQVRGLPSEPPETLTESVPPPNFHPLSYPLMKATKCGCLHLTVNILVRLSTCITVDKDEFDCVCFGVICVLGDSMNPRQFRRLGIGVPIRCVAVHGGKSQ